MRFVTGSFFFAGLIMWQTATSWAIGPMGFSDPPPAPPAHGSQRTPPSAPKPVPTTPSAVTGDGSSTSTGDSSTFDPQSSGYGASDSWGGATGSCGCRSCGRHRLGSCLTSGIFCNMPQHYPYPTTWDRYYYFRPYQYFQVTQLQETVASWGLDPRNISDNSFFEKIYEEVGAPANPNEYQTVPRPKSEPVHAPKPAPSNFDDQGSRDPGHDAPPLKFTQQAEPKRSVRKATRPKTSKPKSASIRDGKQVELIRFVVP